MELGSAGQVLRIDDAASPVVMAWWVGKPDLNRVNLPDACKQMCDFQPTAPYCVAFEAELVLLFVFGTYLLPMVAVAVSPSLRVMYNELDLPCCALPTWLFGIMWLVLYTLSGVAAGLVRIYGGPWVTEDDFGTENNLTALVLYCVLQGVLALYIIFGSRRYHWVGVFVIFAALVLAVITTILFATHSYTAMGFMIALATWLAVALALQVSIALLNYGSVSNQRGAKKETDPNETVYFAINRPFELLRPSPTWALDGRRGMPVVSAPRYVAESLAEQLAAQPQFAQVEPKYGQIVYPNNYIDSEDE